MVTRGFSVGEKEIYLKINKKMAEWWWTEVERGSYVALLFNEDGGVPVLKMKRILETAVVMVIQQYKCTRCH